MANKIITLLLILFLASCASIVPPSGGPKDTTPPVCEEKVPKDNTLNFNSKTIEFHFDEYVVLNDITNQFIISPPLEEKPAISIRGKKVEVEFKEELKPNTTYTINFGNGIKDNNEGNTLSGLSYTFSTGDYIDSLSLDGKVKDAYTQLPKIDAAIGLYKIEDDSTIFKTKPWYLTRPDSSGNYKFNYLSPGEYQLVAFEDLNRNLKIESNEKIAFYPKQIKLSYEESDTLTQLYPLFISEQYIKVAPKIITYKELAKGKYQIVTGGSNCNYSIDEGQLSNKSSKVVIATPKFCDTITVFTNKECIDSTMLKVKVDSIEENIIINCKSKEYSKFLVNSSSPATNYNFLKPITLNFTTPPVEIRENEIKLMEDSIEIKDISVKKDSNNPLSLYIDYKLKPETPYTLILPQACIKDIYAQELDSLGIKLTTAKTAFFGNLSILVENKDSAQLIVQLLDQQSNIVKEDIIKSSKTLSYNNTIPGQYFVKVIEDENKNEVWDAGNYFLGKQPERVYITPKSIEVRANWDITDIKIEHPF